MRSTLFLLSAYVALVAAVPLEARDHPMSGMTMTGTTTAAAHAMTDMPMMMARDVAHGKKGNDEKKASSSSKKASSSSKKASSSSKKMSMAKGMTMHRRDSPMTMSGMTMTGTTTAAAHAMTDMPMMVRDLLHGKKGNDEKKSSSSSKKASSTKKMSMAKGMTMRARNVAHGDDDEPAATATADPMAGMNMRVVQHGKKKDNDDKKASSTSKKATKTSMSMKKGMTMHARAVAHGDDDEPAATTTADPMAGMNMRVVLHGKKGNDEKKSSSTLKKVTKTSMSMKKGMTMHARAVADDAPTATTDAPMAGMDMHRRAMTMAATATMDAAMMKAHHPEWASMAADMKGMDMTNTMTMAA